MIILTVVGSVTGASLSLLATVVELHATYFMNPPPPNTGRIVMNLLGLAVLIGALVMQESSFLANGKSRKPGIQPLGD
jgi:hypothetical protein